MYFLYLDTNQYSADFNRELCAYLTGHVNVGYSHLDEVDMYLENFPEKHPKSIHVEGMYSDCVESKRFFDNGVGHVYERGQEEDALRIYKEYYEDYREKALSNLDVVLGSINLTFANYEETDVNKFHDSERLKIESEVSAALERDEVPVVPVKYAVMMFFKQRLTEEEFSTIVSRAREFEEYYEEGLKIHSILFTYVDEESVEEIYSSMALLQK